MMLTRRICSTGAVGLKRVAACDYYVTTPLTCAKAEAHVTRRGSVPHPIPGPPTPTNTPFMVVCAYGSLIDMVQTYSSTISSMFEGNCKIEDSTLIKGSSKCLYKKLT